MYLAPSTVEVLPPELIPTEETAIRWRCSKAGSLSEQVGLNASSLTVAHLIDSLRQSVTALDATRPTKSTFAGREEDAVHDAYFRISRVEGDGVAILVRMTIRARLILAEEVMDPALSLPAASWQVIDRSLVDLLCMLLGNTLATVTATVPEAGTAPFVPALNRWIRGHQIFAILTQGLLFSLRSMTQSIRMGDAESISRHADLSASLLRGSGETLRFTGEFDAEEYMRVIRPSMMPPAVPICLSGLMSIDHRHLVQLLREMRPALKQLREREPIRHEALLTELGKVYDSHIHVCERFVGNMPSIRTADSTEKSGPDLLRNFRTLRLKPFEHI